MSPLRQESVSETRSNVLVVGETGIGKSSVVNLIAGKQLAEVDSGADCCTLEATSYDIALPDHQGLDHDICLFDTVGVNEPQFEKTNYLSAIEKANTLICQLQKAGGIHLLLFCIRGSRITATTQNNFALFRDILCQNRVTVALIITGTENERPMEMWWQKNESKVKAYDLSCASHVCVAAIRGPDNRFAKEYDESQTKVRDMLLTHVTGEALPWQMEQKAWLIDLAGKLLRWLSRGQRLTELELAGHLRRRCGFTKSDAQYLAKKILSERQENASPNLVGLYKSDNSQSFHVILFGGTGVGKSAIVNLIAKGKPAKTSPDAGASTFTSTSYRVDLQLESNRSFCLWDTISLDEPDISLADYLRAVKQAYKLIKELERRGGVHLLLFCTRGGRITKSHEQNYKLFVNVLCKGRVPACIVVTGLERERRMDDWWATNAEELARRGIVPDGHACITAICDHGPQDVRNKYEESRRNMCSLLLDPRKPSNEGVKRTLPPISSSDQPTAQELAKRRVQECGFSDSTASAIAASIEEMDQLPPGSNK